MDRPQATDRRGALRRPCQARGLWWPVSFFTAGIWQAQVCDFSEGGLALTVDEPEEPGTFLVLRTNRPEEALPRLFRMQVMHVTARDRRSWVLGCRFEHQLEAEDLELFAAANDGAVAS
jgi:hypothetical protein